MAVWDGAGAALSVSLPNVYPTMSCELREAVVLAPQLPEILIPPLNYESTISLFGGGELCTECAS